MVARYSHFGVWAAAASHWAASAPTAASTRPRRRRSSRPRAGTPPSASTARRTRSCDEQKDLRAVDRVATALERLGCARVLSSGGAATARGGRSTLWALQKACGRRRIAVVVAGGVSEANAGLLVRDTGCTQLHAATALAPHVARAAPTSLFFATEKVVCADRVASLNAALAAAAALNEAQATTARVVGDASAPVERWWWQAFSRILCLFFCKFAARRPPPPGRRGVCVTARPPPHAVRRPGPSSVLAARRRRRRSSNFKRHWQRWAPTGGARATGGRLAPHRPHRPRRRRPLLRVRAGACSEQRKRGGYSPARTGARGRGGGGASCLGAAFAAAAGGANVLRAGARFRALLRRRRRGLVVDTEKARRRRRKLSRRSSQMGLWGASRPSVVSEDDESVEFSKMDQPSTTGPSSSSESTTCVKIVTPSSRRSHGAWRSLISTLSRLSEARRCAGGRAGGAASCFSAEGGCGRVGKSPQGLLDSLLCWFGDG